MNYQEITVIGSLFIFGLLGGFSHCAGMCGPFVLTQIGNRLGEIPLDQITVFRKLSGIALIPYHCGRITTYCFIASISSFLSDNLKNIIYFKQFAGLFLIIGALIIFNSTITKIKLPFRINCKLPTFIKNLINSLFLNPTGLSNYYLGLMLGFIPCGLVYGAIVTTLSLDNHLAVLLAMLAFGIGTVPSLFLTACGGYWFLNNIQKHLKSFTRLMLFGNIAVLLIMACGLILNLF